MNSPKHVFDLRRLASVCDHPDQQDEESLRYFDSIADRIVGDIGPHTVLDASCVIGALVEGLRRRGVEGWGAAISGDASADVHPDIRPYCRVGPLTDPLPQRYDLIVCNEMLTHLPKPVAEQVIANLCVHTDDILFSSMSCERGEFTCVNVQPPEYWAELFAGHGFFRDVDFDASFMTPWAVRFRRGCGPVRSVIAAYERRLWLVEQENHARREFGVEQSIELSRKEQVLAGVTAQLAEKTQDLATAHEQLAGKTQDLATAHEQLAGILNSRSWRLVQRLRRIRLGLVPLGSRREDLIYDVIRGIRLWRHQGPAEATRRVGQKFSRWTTHLFYKLRLSARRCPPSQVIRIEEVFVRPPVERHQDTVDVIICVHNALKDVERCLESVVQYTTPPYSLIIVDDGSDSRTRDYLDEFARKHTALVTLLRNERAAGYTRAANRALKESSADYAVLLNSDTVVAPEWLDRLIACCDSDPRIGLAGPLSNTASWQSIPDIEFQGDWASNELRPEMSIEQMSRLIANHSARLYPRMPFLNGFCLLIRRQVLQTVGYFDEDNFGEGYGEENDYCLRAQKAGWHLALADDVYVYHAQSSSYPHETRKRLCENAGWTLAKKHGQGIISEGVAYCRCNRVLEGIRARSGVTVERHMVTQQGKDRFAGRRVIFLLPISMPSGGGNVVLTEARAMKAMGVEVMIFNIRSQRTGFSRGYPYLDLPIIYGEADDIGSVCRNYDAVVATFNPSVGWMRSIEDRRIVRGYYVQDFEPYFYEPDTEGFRCAYASYSLFPDLVRFAKTEWTRQELWNQAGVDCSVVGPSVDIDLVRPRPRRGPEWPSRPLAIAAMIRPESSYRQPALTMELMREVTRKYGGAVEVILFGTEADNPGFATLHQNFPWKLAGVLCQRQVAALLNEVDIFVDLSSYQAMGLTVLEAMACGVATIVPMRGGAVQFARNGENSVVVDTSSMDACWDALRRLIEDTQFRTSLQQQALREVVSCFPERPALNILGALFDGH